GFGEYICVPDDWIVPLPDGLSLKESMMIGTAGFTAGYGILKIIQNLPGSAQNTSPDYAKASSGKPSNPAQISSHDSFPSDSCRREALVTGATGGVGSLAVAVLSKVGFKVIAVTGKSDQHEYLKRIG